MLHFVAEQAGGKTSCQNGRFKINSHPFLEISPSEVTSTTWGDMCTEDVVLSEFLLCDFFFFVMVLSLCSCFLLLPVLWVGVSGCFVAVASCVLCHVTSLCCDCPPRPECFHLVLVNLHFLVFLFSFLLVPKCHLGLPKVLFWLCLVFVFFAFAPVEYCWFDFFGQTLYLNVWVCLY